tara:strand:- start:582 stop:1025 length:444 start_codon:yes stop_codon:yes gene_type:complete
VDVRNDEHAQIHILEMLTLFWLFFMTAAFLITVHVPDEASISVDAEMKFAGEDAINLAKATAAEGDDYDSKLAELLSSGEENKGCELIQNYLSTGIEANCWLAKDSATLQPYGEVASPGSNTITTHSLIIVDDHLWTISLDLWERGS